MKDRIPHALRQVVRYAGMPVIFAAAVAVTYGLLDAGLARGAVLGVMSVLVFLMVWGLEQLVPYRPEWNPRDGQRWNDFGHAIVGTWLGGALGNALTYAACGAAALWVADHVGAGLWPTRWPFAVQVAMVTLLADLGRYVQHRAMHEVPLLWRFHALHHSSDVLTVWKTSRNHTVERFFQQLFLFGPAILLGASSHVLLPFIVANTFLGVLDHSNVDFRLGFFERVLMGPAAHRIHHSRDIAESSTNYGTALLVWDFLFGTYTNAPRRALLGPVDVGIEDDPTPQTFVGQVLDPFLPGGWNGPRIGERTKPRWAP